MSTPESPPALKLTLKILPPPGSAAVSKIYSAYDIPASQTPDTTELLSSPDPSISLFASALLIRHPVFIIEQSCPLPEEIDSDDARSWHFLAYTSEKPSPSDETQPEPQSQHPIATIRVVPGPHAPHPLPGSVDGVGGTAHAGTKPDGARDVRTKFHDGVELYVKIGRVATLREFRGKGVGAWLMREVLRWMSAEKTKLGWDGHDDGGRAGVVEEENVGRVGHEEREREKGWKGLILVHAQKYLVPMYRKTGFELDVELGEWVEVGIPHVALWTRVKT